MPYFFYQTSEMEITEDNFLDVMLQGPGSPVSDGGGDGHDGEGYFDAASISAPAQAQMPTSQAAHDASLMRETADEETVDMIELSLKQAEAALSRRIRRRGRCFEDLRDGVRDRAVSPTWRPHI